MNEMNPKTGPQAKNAGKRAPRRRTAPDDNPPPPMPPADDVETPPEAEVDIGPAGPVDPSDPVEIPAGGGSSAPRPGSVSGDSAAEGFSPPDVLPVLGLRGMVLFPDMLMPLTVTEASDITLVDQVLLGDRSVAVVPRLRESDDPGDVSGLHRHGTAAMILKMMRLPDGGMRLLVQGVRRIRIETFLQRKPFLVARTAARPDRDRPGVEADALYRSVRQQFERLMELLPQIPDELKVAAVNITAPGRFADLVAANLNLSLEERCEILDADDINQRLLRVSALLARETQIVELGSKIQEDVKSKIGQGQREYYLREQLKTIRRELGEEDERVELSDLEKSLAEAKLTDEARKEADRELSRLARMQAGSAEYTVGRTYLDWLATLPWGKYDPDRIDLPRARRILDADHYGLKKIKERIHEFLAVRKIHPEGRSPILCFVGPPGVGKTSLGRSIARAMGRGFERISLGGVRDEAEIRGHRRTYVGAMPGRVIQALRRAGTANPVFVLDEIDKLASDYRGDPSAALLEVLDPEQNAHFRDHYLDVAFDLSRIVFITTANQLDPIPAALRDRMEVIPLAGYSEEEKIHIARRHLLPRVRSEHGLSAKQLVVPTAALKRVIHDYTREAGLRNLERELAALARKTAMAIAKTQAEDETQAGAGKRGAKAAEKTAAAQKRAMARAKAKKDAGPPLAITADTLEALLGPPRFFESVVSATERPGVAIGLAWSPSGGDVLFIEAAQMAGKKGLTLTGSLGDVIKESATAALSWLRMHAESLGLKPDFFEDRDLHIHFPEGATPKDGPSAGIALVVALTSLFSDRPVRQRLAMTGEITLRGKVLPVGGVKEKALAARRAGVTDVILPAPNMRDLTELPPEVKRSLRFHPVEEITEALSIAFPKRASGLRRTRGKADFSH